MIQSSFTNYKLSAFIYCTFISIFFIYIEWFPIKHSLFDFALCGCIGLILFFLTRKIYASFVLAASICVFIIIASIFKQIEIGAYLFISDVIFFFTDPGFVFNFVSIPLLLILLFVFVTYVSLLYFHESKSKITFFHIIVFIGTLFILNNQLQKFEKRMSWNTHKYSTTLQNFVASGFSRKVYSLPISKKNDATCCHIVNPTDLNISFKQNIKPNIVFVLLESTFNLNFIPDLALTNQWTHFKSNPLKVVVAGAGTWTAEYAILHGVNPMMYGKNFKQINFWGPGILQGRIAPSLKKIGYQAHSVMPYSKKFFNNGNYHRSLGIEDIIDCKKMNIPCEYNLKTGAYKDSIMYEQVYKILLNANNPQFVFALTMLQHSPHNLSTKNTSIKCDLLSARACDVLQEYKNREEIIQSQIQNFVQKINLLQRETIVVFFGDHIPTDIYTSVPQEKFLNHSVYTTIAFAYSNKTKDFIDLKKIIGNCHPNFRMHIEDLDILPLQFVGMESNYIKQKYAKLKQSCISGSRL